MFFLSARNILDTGNIQEADDIRPDFVIFLVELFDKVSAPIGRQWKQVGGRLGLSRTELDEAARGCPMGRASDKAYNMLKLWKQTYATTLSQPAVKRRISDVLNALNMEYALGNTFRSSLILC